MENEAVKAPYMCIYVMRGMYKNRIPADSITDLHNKLSYSKIVTDESIEGMTDLEILNKIYADSTNTTGRLAVYKYNTERDLEAEREEEDSDDTQYILCKNGVY